MHKRKKIVLCCLVVILVVFAAWIIRDNKALELNTYTITSERLPDGFSGFHIAHVSDLHNTQIGENNKKLLDMLYQSRPDMIAITGDLIDSRNTDISIAIQFAEEAVKIAPCYYVTGNHEARVAEYDSLKNHLIELGVTILEDTALVLEIQNQTITLIGVDDPSFQTDYLFGDSESVMNDKLQSLISNDNGFYLLLSHRPELFQIYAQNDVDLVLSGHAHGGQFRLPHLGGLIAPNQGLFPKYDAGLYVDGNTHMVVSRGIGNSIIPFRINNRPEVSLIELQST